MPVLEGGESGLQAAARLRIAFERSRHPMLIADDQRRWVTGNNAACDLLGVPAEEIPWRTMDEFTPPAERRRLEEQWAAFLASGGAEGWYQLYVPNRGPLPVEFSATANVLPARHLSVFIPPDEASVEQARRRPRSGSILGAGCGRGQRPAAAHRSRARDDETGCFRAAEWRHRRAPVSLAGDDQVTRSQCVGQAGSTHSRTRRCDRVGNRSDQLGGVAPRNSV